MGLLCSLCRALARHPLCPRAPFYLRRAFCTSLFSLEPFLSPHLLSWSVLLSSHPFSAPPVGPWYPEDTHTLLNSLLSSLRPQDIFGLSGPFGTSLIPLTMPLVLPEPFLKPSVCSRVVHFVSVLSYTSILYLVPQRCLSSAQISS